MHLKVCPKTECGKVSDVSAAVCESCGKPFPNIDLVSIGTTSTAESVASQAHGSDPIAAGKDKPRVAAWPLIMMAIVAGGIPLLWANRSHLPTPKTWQVDTAAPTAPVTIPLPAAIPTASSGPVAVPAAAPQPQAEPISVPPKEVAAAVASEAATVSAAGGEESAAKARIASSAKKRAKEAAAAKPKDSGPCTEAKAALGLCAPRASGK